MAKQDPYELLSDGAKTTLTAPGGVVLGYGPGPGLSQAMFWNRVGSLFSCYRPAVAQLTLFDLAQPHAPVALTQAGCTWEPNHVQARWAADGVTIAEDRFATKRGLVSRLRLTSTSEAQRSWLLLFHGQVQQWAFFDYQRGVDEPQVRCETHPRAGRIIITQPHPHHGLPAMSSVQTLCFGKPLACYGSCLSEGDLRTLWHDHGALESLRLRLGQTGGRFVEQLSGADAAPAVFSHRQPLYYAGVRVELKPGRSSTVTVRCEFGTTDEAALSSACGTDCVVAEEQPRSTAAHLAAEAKAWRQYLNSGVPQLECDDAELTRYWYYVWYVLRANRTAPGAHIRHAFTAPSKYMYWGPWIWDGYFHVLGEMWLKDREVAQDSIRAVLDMQFPNGFIPVCSGSNYRMCFHDSVAGYDAPGGGGYASYVLPELRGYREEEHPFEAQVEFSSGRGGFQPPNGGVAGMASSRRSGRRQNAAATGSSSQGRLLSQAGGTSAAPTVMLHNEKTQTPLIGVAAALYCALHGDAEFAREVLPALWAYEEWLWRRRSDKVGRFILWHGDESGWDDATRHYPVPAKPVDVQVHCIMHRLALAQLARQAGNGAIEHEAYRRANISLCGLKAYWDSRDRWYYDFAGAGDGQRNAKRRKQIAPSGIFPLLVEQSPRTVAAVLHALSDPRVFGTAFPIPTLAACDPDYAPHGWGWNGPAWLQVNYFAIIGLLQARQTAAALRLWQQTRSLIIRDGAPHSYELYDPELGTGMGCPDYSWQAMVNHLVIHYFAGVPVGLGAITPCLPEGMNYLRLSNLPGGVPWIEYERDKRGLRLRLASTVLPSFDLGLQGAVERVMINGQPAEMSDGVYTAPSGMKAARTWEVTWKWR